MWRYAWQDIEGAEFNVLGRMLMRRVLCSDVIHTMTVEFHNPLWKMAKPAGQRADEAGIFSRHLTTFLNFNPKHCTPTKIINKQDDSYLHDTELPTVCGAMANQIPQAVRRAYPKLAHRFDKSMTPLSGAQRSGHDAF